ncbi:cystathionine gamma-lyase [Labedaea rhizosphaerae]|uniref:Cystathionine gamma-lyase n=1 Tax=Labedaea rhizosphaerae TaxID=598644 RepID=A0A4R6SC10_LABRH|nr:cystathionine gamma-lyase [Labedaea rhizosphaerae]TDP97490.1 cystathionine gamma-lyase [Labedaea rhizosphaerae]
MTGDGTKVVHAGRDVATGDPIAPQPVLASAFHLGGADFYGRAGNPAWRELEAAIGSLDGGECVLFASGMAAIATTLRVLTAPGDTVVVPSDGYYLARRHAGEVPGLAVRSRPTAGPWTAADVEGARLVLLETPSNPGLDVCDIAAITALAHAAGALVAVDNTTATPLGQQPLALGADLVVASDTKALAGHSDVVLGHVSTASAELAARLRDERTVGGAVPGPFEAWLAHRGLGTLDLRLARQAANAATVHEALRDHPAVTGLRWPGASSDPAHEIASRQMRRFNGVITFELVSEEAVASMVARSRLIAPATSFGGLHTTADRRAQWGDPVPDGLVRLSCGVEDPADLVADLLTALT